MCAAERSVSDRHGDYMSIYDTLNDRQKEAVYCTEGPLLILAGAGSGKTRVLTHRIAYLIDRCGVNPWHILAITFTNKAAGEMRERVDNLVGFGSESIWVSTFHSACVRILHRHIDLLGYETNFTIYDTDDQKTVMKDVCKNLQIDTKQLKERAILNIVSNAKNELIDADKFEKNASWDFTQRKVAAAYKEYQQTLRKNNAVDFDDLIMLTVELFRKNPEVLQNYQNRFTYIMVDEYQDTNTAQFELVRLLAEANRNLCVVGDDDQSIYKFRGANIRNILDFEKEYPDAKVVRLEQNYRSTQSILDAANAVISNNEGRKEKRLWTDQGAGRRVRFEQLDTAYEEAEYIADDIARKYRKSGNNFSDFAILYRTNAQSRILEERMVMEGIPYNVVGGTNFYARRELKDMLAYLKTIDNGSDDVAVKRIINVPKRGIGAATIQRVQDYADETGMSFYDALREAEEVPGVGRSLSKLTSFVTMIQAFRGKMEYYTLKELLEDILEQTGYLEELRASGEEDADDRIDNVEELLNKLVSYEESTEEPSLSEFLEQVALVSDIDNVAGGDGRVLLMTLHSAKGLEFPHVYLAGLEDGLFPSYMNIISEDPDDLEEERRLAYVGITRAMQELTLTCARQRMVRGETQYNAVSRFVREIPASLLDGYVPPLRSRAEDSFRFGDDKPLPFYSSSERQGQRSTGGVSAGQSTGRFSPGQSDGYKNSLSGNRDGAQKRGYAAGTETAGGYGTGSAGSGLAGGYGGSPMHTFGNGGLKRVTRTAEQDKPYIARAGGASGLQNINGLSKGMPTAGGVPDYGVGDRVLHTKYGEGTVTALEKGTKDYQVTVMFDQVGKRSMYAGFAKLKKL